MAISRYFLILLQSGQDRLGDFNYRVLRRVQRNLDRVVKTAPKATEIDVWLESPGGDAHVAYRLFLDLQHRCRTLRVVIPDYAKSAATLFALGADEIYMAPSAELGPLDAQIEHPDREGVPVSALDVSKALGFLGDFALDYIAKGGNSILQSTGLPRAEVLREFSRFAARFLEPVVTKLDPHLVHRAAKQLAVAHHYAKKMLELRRLSEEDKKRKCNADEIVTHLVEEYPAHECVISRDEARDLPLPVKDAENYDRWDVVKAVCNLYHDGGLVSPDESWSHVNLLNEKELDELESTTEDEDETESEQEESEDLGEKGEKHENRADLQTSDGKAPEMSQGGQKDSGT